MRSAAAALLLAFTAAASFAGWSSSGPTGGGVRSVVVAPSDPAVIWAGNAAGVYRSADGGATWANVSGPIANVDFIVVHPADPARAWVLSGSLGAARLHRTADGGATWKAVPGLQGLTVCVDEMSLDPFSPWRVFITGPFSDIAGQSESYDAARTFERVPDPVPSLGVVFDPRYPFTHYGVSAKFGSRFFLSQDGGFTWRAVGTPPQTLTSITIDPERGRLFVGTVGGVFRSGNSGRSWAESQVPPVLVSSVAFGGQPASLFAGSAEGLLRAANRGLGEASRIELPRDISAHVTGLAIDPSNPNILYAATRTFLTTYVSATRGRVMRSTDGGVSWERLPGDDDLPKADLLAVDAAGTLYAAAYSGPDLYRRARGETKWTRVRGFPFVQDIAADPKNAGTLFVYGGGAVDRTRDGGATWERVLNALSGPGTLAIDPSDPRWVYLGNEYEFYRSSDGGTTWTTLIPYTANSGTRGLSVSPADGAVLYRIEAVSGRPRPERSNDRGATWTPIPLPQGVFPSTIAADPRNAAAVWSGAAGQIYRSDDGGATWQKVEGPFVTAEPPYILRFDARGVLHAVWPQHGVWELASD